MQELAKNLVMLYVIDGFNWAYRKMHSHMRPKLIEAT